MPVQNTFIRELVARTVFPTVVFAVLSLSWLMVQQGFSSASIIGSVSATTVLIIALLERLFPFRSLWNHNLGDIKPDILHNILSSYASREVYKILCLIAMAPLVTLLAESNPHGVWQTYAGDLPLAAQVFLVAAIAEFGNYWGHRASHELDVFWRFHSVHHSPLRLYWLNAGRDHPVSVLLLFVLASVPLIALGVPGEILVLFYVLEAVHGLFQHCNIYVRLGPLNWVFSMAELHRWHHSEKLAEANHNYGLTLIIWDIVFGTRFLPNLDGPEKIGIDYLPNYPKTFWQHMLVPFRWAKLQAEAKSVEDA